MTVAAADFRDRLLGLPPGGRAVMVFANATQQVRFVDRCMIRGNGSFGLVSAGTTLVGSLSMLDNLRLPVYYHGHSIPQVTEDLETLCRIAKVDARTLLPLLASAASRVERIQGSFLQAALLRPEIMLFDGIFESLGAVERETVAALIAAFHRFFPLRRSAYLGVAAPPEGLYPHETWIEA